MRLPSSKCSDALIDCSILAYATPNPSELVVILRLRGCLLIQSIGFFKLIPMHLLPCLIASVNAMEEALKV